MTMKITSHMAPVDMTFTLQITGLSHRQLRVLAVIADGLARSAGEVLDLSRIAPTHPFPQNFE